ARFAYNWGLARWIEIYEKEGRTTNAMELHRELNRLKKTDFPWMYEVSKWAPQEALRDLEKAFQNFFRGRKTGRKVGHPKFRRKHDRGTASGWITVPARFACFWTGVTGVIPERRATSCSLAFVVRPSFS
ncbi:helix-turn-helix domain-containing protein, partial [Hydrogenibacillus schlegelii]|uniref:helix-turn-helix domain-containing protein n=1 Tax=Hydrogenibacillus schlegelii TaxID=1484 RepID=UPI00349FDE7B